MPKAPSKARGPRQSQALAATRQLIDLCCYDSWKDHFIGTNNNTPAADEQFGLFFGCSKPASIASSQVPNSGQEVTCGIVMKTLRQGFGALNGGFFFFIFFFLCA